MKCDVLTIVTAKPARLYLVVAITVRIATVICQRRIIRALWFLFINYGGWRVGMFDVDITLRKRNRYITFTEASVYLKI